MLPYIYCLPIYGEYPIMAHLVKVKLTNPSILTRARGELGLTTPEVAKRFNKTTDIIDAWEQGNEASTFRQLIELANYYKRPVAAFFLHHRA